MVFLVGPLLTRWHGCYRLLVCKSGCQSWWHHWTIETHGHFSQKDHFSTIDARSQFQLMPENLPLTPSSKIKKAPASKLAEPMMEAWKDISGKSDGALRKERCITSVPWWRRGWPCTENRHLRLSSKVVQKTDSECEDILDYLTLTISLSLTHKCDIW